MKGLDYIKAPDMPPEYVAYVSPNFHYDSYKQTFPTIQEAIDYMYGRYGWVFGMTINVYPGTYNEQIHSFPIFFIKGIVHNKPSSEQRVVTLYNTGADPDHYPLRANDGDGYMIHNMNIKTDYGGTFGRLGNDRYVSCNFSGGSFIESTQDVSIFESWADCSFVNCPAFNVTGVAPQGRYLVFEDCWFGWWQTMRFESTHTAGNAVFDMDGGHLAFTKLSLKGDWYHFAKNYHSFGAYRTDYDTTKGIVYRNVTISNGIHFFSNPMSFKMIGCEMEDAAEMPIPDGEADITADVAITDVNFQNNSMHNGLSGEIEIQGKLRSVGGNEINKYISIQDAIDSLTSDGIIFLQPGTYTEQLHSRAEILIQGRTHEGVPAVKSTILYNTGVDSAHYPLGGDDTDVFNISDITIKTEPDAVIGKLSASNFTGVVFQNGYFIEATANQAMLMGLSDCSFEDTMAFNLTGVGSGGLRAMTIVGCYFNDYATHWKMDSTHDATLVIVKNSIFHNAYPDVGGNWQVEISNSHSFGTSRNVISTTNKIAYIQCIVSNGLHFTSNPDTTIQLCTFNDDCGYLISGEDITADVDVTDVSYVQNVQQNGISGRIHTISKVVNAGGDSVCKYYSIQDAINSLSSGGMVFIAPGTYTEQIYSKANITLQGYTTEGPPAKKSTVIYNTGADADHYPLRGGDDDYYVIDDITIETDTGGVIGKLGNNKFSGCVFSKGHFIEATKNADMLLGIDNCTFLDSMAFDLTGVGSGGLRAMTVIGCFFNDHTTHCNFNSTHTTTLAVVKNCVFHKSYPDIGGNWAFEMSDCHILGTSRSIISTTNKVTYIKCITSNGLHFTSNPDTIIQLCTFNDDCGYPITGADITAALNVTDVDYVSNVQQNGLAGEIQIRDPIKPVGGDAVNRYITIQDAIDSIVTSGIVELHESFTGLSELIIPNNTKVTMDGRRVYSLGFTGDIVELGLNEKLILNNISEITGMNAEINGNGAELHMHACPCGSNSMQILVTSGVGAKVHLRNTNILGATGCSPLQVNSLDPEYLFSYSRLVGAIGQPAIEYTVLASSKMRSRFSTFVHGDGGINAPLTYIGAGKVIFSMYSCGLNAAWNPASFTNAIGSANNTTDPNIDF